MKALRDRFRIWLQLTLGARGLVAALCICAIGLAVAPWSSSGESGVKYASITFLFVVSYQIIQLILVTINEKKDEKKSEIQEELLHAVLAKCSTIEDVKGLLGEDVLNRLGADFIRKLQADEYWESTD